MLLASRVSGVEGGWSPYPGAREATAFRLPPVEPGRVVALGATCDLSPWGSHGTKDLSFWVSEFVTLEDGRRVLLHTDRGWTDGLRSTGPSDPGDLRDFETLDRLTETVLQVVLPDDEDDPEPHPWAWLAELARSRGLDVTADDLRVLPYEVVFTEKLRRWLAEAGP